jgi:hypothetical protein
LIVRDDDKEETISAAPGDLPRSNRALIAYYENQGYFAASRASCCGRNRQTDFFDL